MCENCKKIKVSNFKIFLHSLIPILGFKKIYNCPKCGDLYIIDIEYNDLYLNEKTKFSLRKFLLCFVSYIVSYFLLAPIIPHIESNIPFYILIIGFVSFLIFLKTFKFLRIKHLIKEVICPLEDYSQLIKLEKLLWKSAIILLAICLILSVCMKFILYIVKISA